MHLARDPAALVLLREDQPRQELGTGALGFGLPAFRQVEVGADDAHDRTAGLAPDRVTAREHLDVVAVLVAEPELALIRACAARDAVVDLLRPGHVLRVQQAFPRADMRLDLVIGVAEHLFPARRVDDVAGDEIPVPDPFLGPRERQRQALLAFAQRRVRPFTFRDLVQRPDDGRRRVRLVQPREGDLDVNDRTIGLNDLMLERRNGPAVHRTGKMVAP